MAEGTRRTSPCLICFKKYPYCYKNCPDYDPDVWLSPKDLAKMNLAYEELTSSYLIDRSSRIAHNSGRKRPR